MPNPRRHRGPHPDDARLFAAAALARLRAAGEELSFLLSRDYPIESALGLVGNHHQLDARQRLALQRTQCGEAALAQRLARRLDGGALRGQPLLVDGFNLVITLEVALSGGLLLAGREGALRDLAGLRGSYRLVQETERALALLDAALGELGPSSVRVLLDEPVSNSGRLRQRLLAVVRSVPIEVELLPDPDAALVGGERVASADGAVLDACRSWFNLAAWIVARQVPQAWVVRLS